MAKSDTMSKIARKFHVTVEQLLAANPKVKNPDRIAIGDELNDPGARSRTPEARTRPVGRGAARVRAVSARTASG